MIQEKQIEPCTEELLIEFKNEFPEDVSELWKNDGFSWYCNGLFRTVNPNDWKHIQQEWVDSEFFTLDFKSIHVFGITALGFPMIWVNKPDESGYMAIFDILNDDYGVLFNGKFSFFWNVLLSDESYLKMKLDKDFIDSAYNKLGDLESDECFGIVPLPALGGDKNIEHVEIVKLNEYLNICAQSHT